MTSAFDESGSGEDLIAGSVWREEEDEDECWTGEVQVVGGYYVAATVHGSSEEEVRRRQAAVIAALSAASAPVVSGREAVEAETYRDMHEIATKDLGYPSILEALEAAPHATARPTPEQGVREALERVVHENGPVVVDWMGDALAWRPLDCGAPPLDYRAWTPLATSAVDPVSAKEPSA